MNEPAQIILIILLILCAIGSFAAGIAMLLVRPPRIDPDTGEPSYVWKAFTLLMFVLCVANVRGVYEVKVNSIDSWWGVGVRIGMAITIGLILVALWHRAHAISQGKLSYDLYR